MNNPVASNLSNDARSSAQQYHQQLAELDAKLERTKQKLEQTEGRWKKLTKKRNMRINLDSHPEWKPIILFSVPAALVGLTIVVSHAIFGWHNFHLVSCIVAAILGLIGVYFKLFYPSMAVIDRKYLALYHKIENTKAEITELEASKATLHQTLRSNEQPL